MPVDWELITCYNNYMITFLNIILILSLVMVFGALAFGLFSFLRGGEFNKKHGNQAMQWRVILQGVALLIFLLILLLGR